MVLDIMLVIVLDIKIVTDITDKFTNSAAN